jgi:glyoxylase-like metal-dependent hydrolase (beta-lactamase superfamily II)
MNVKMKTIMSSERYRFDVGSFECIAVSDGTFAYPHPSKNVFINFFVNAQEDRLGRVLRDHGLVPEQWEEYVSPYTCMVIIKGNDHVLVDTGAGKMAPTTGKLIPNLEAEGISPEDIDTVILTHGHPDHIGGTIDGEGKPAFPNARYVMWKDEWDFWTSDPDLSGLKIDDHGKEILVKFAQNALPPIRDRLELIEREAEIRPGIRAVSAPGHTPGHMAVAVDSDDAQLLYISDTVLHPIHLEQPGWCSSVAFDPEKVTASRIRLLSKAASEKALVIATHFPFPGLGYIEKKEEAWKWRPL